MRSGDIWDFLWMHTKIYRHLMILLLSGTPPMRPPLLLHMLHFLVHVTKLVLRIAALLLLLAVLLLVAKRSLMDEETEEEEPLNYCKHPDFDEDEDTSEDAARDDDE